MANEKKVGGADAELVAAATKGEVAVRELLRSRQAASVVRDEVRLPHSRDEKCPVCNKGFYLKGVPFKGIVGPDGKLWGRECLAKFREFGRRPEIAKLPMERQVAEAVKEWKRMMAEKSVEGQIRKYGSV